MQSSPSPNFAGGPMQVSPSEEKALLTRGRDNDMNWTWSETDKEKWKVETGGCQKFYDHWRGGTNKSKFLHEFPYRLSLGMGGNKRFIPLSIPTKHGNEILVTESYEKTFHHLLLLRKLDKGSLRGAVITGQAGIGKTMLLVFLLVRLLSHDQVVLLRGNNTTLLFYHGQVYSRSVRDGLKNLPHSQKGFPEGQGYLPVWGLVDRDSDKYGPDPSPRSNTWVIQACSPQPDRYESWRKHTGAALLGMPLWNLRELMAGLLLVPEYDDFRSGLEGCLRTLKRSANPDINATLKVLKAEAREMVAAKIGTSYDVEKALEILVRNAIEEVGFAPRDVYNCVFLLAATKHEHACAVNELTYLAFQRTAWALVEDGGLPQESHLVVAVWPRELGVHHVTWSIGFKSNRIAKMVAITMRLAEGTYLQQTYDLLHRIPATSAMAGQFFEAYAHRMFSTPYKASRSAPQPVLMTSDNNNPPTFSSDRSISPPPNQSIPPPIRPSKRHVIYVGLPHDLRRVTLGGDRYYTSTSLNNPLFDSFTIDHDPRVRTVVLSIFQMTSSQKHGKSGEGYSYIQIIITHIRKLLGDEGPTTTVKPIYFLVCPEGKSENQWTMPLGWETKNTRNSPEKNMHVGDVFCIRFPGFDYLEDSEGNKDQA